MEPTLDLSTAAIAEHAHDSCLRIDALAPNPNAARYVGALAGPGAGPPSTVLMPPSGHTASTRANDCSTTMYGPPLAGSGHGLAGGAFVRSPRDRGLSDTI
jgi:hypothetical protein